MIAAAISTLSDSARQVKGFGLRLGFRVWGVGCFVAAISSDVDDHPMWNVGVLTRGCRGTSTSRSCRPPCRARALSRSSWYLPTRVLCHARY
eukprot:2283597-Rhodomonas_salina.2